MTAPAQIQIDTRLDSGRMFNLPVLHSEPLTVDWGDGIVQVVQPQLFDPNVVALSQVPAYFISHLYAQEGRYVVKFSSESGRHFRYGVAQPDPAFPFANPQSVYQFGTAPPEDVPSSRMIQSVLTWGDQRFQWVHFYKASNLTSVPNFLPKRDAIAYFASWMFGECTSFNGNVSNFDLDRVFFLGNMFNGATSFNRNISGWQPTNAVILRGMFRNATAFNQNIGLWPFSTTVTSGAFERMFQGATSFNQDLSLWCVSNAFAEPDLFDEGATSWTLPRPQWGTCPSGFEVLTGFPDVGFFTATVTGEIKPQSIFPIVERGFKFGTTPNPTAKTQVGSGFGTYSTTFTGLPPGVTRYVRAYAINSNGLELDGDVVEFATLSPQPVPFVNVTMPTVDENKTSLGSVEFEDPMDTGTYQWTVSPFNVFVDGLFAGNASVPAGQGTATPTIRFQPAPNWFGTAEFSITVSNGFATSEPSPVTVTINPVPDPPSAVVGELPTLDEDDTAEFELTWTDIDDIPPGSLKATDGYNIEVRSGPGRPFRTLTDEVPTARLDNWTVRVLSYSDSQLKATLRVEPDANYNGPYSMQVRVRDAVDDVVLFGPSRTLTGTIISVPDAPTRPTPSRMNTGRVGQSVQTTFRTFDPDLEDTSWLFEISRAGASTYGQSVIVPGVGKLDVIDPDLSDQQADVRLDQSDPFTGPLEQVRYSFDDNNLNAEVSFGGQGSDIQNGSLNSLTTGNLGYSSDPVLIVGPASGAVDEATAIANDSYFEFTARLGSNARWTSLEFLAARGGTATPSGYAVRTSADGFSTTLKTEDIPTERTDFTAFTVPLTSLPQGQPVTFRIYVYDPGTFVDFDNIVLKGATKPTLRYEFDLRVTDSSGLTSPTQTVTGFLTPPTATVFLQRVIRDSGSTSIEPLTPLREVFDLNVVDSIDGVGAAYAVVATDELRRRASQLNIDIRDLVDPGNVELVVAIGTEVVFCGPVGDVEWSATGQTIEISARGLLGYLEDRRISTGTKSFVGEDISNIVATLVADTQAQSFGDLGIVDDTSPAGTNLTVDFSGRDRVLRAIRDLSQAEGGPEVWIEPTRELRAEQSRGFDKRSIVFISAGMMSAAEWKTRDELIATVVTVVGGPDGSNGFFEGTAVTSDSAALAKYGRRERVLERPALTSNQECEDYARRQVDQQSRRLEDVRLRTVVTPDRPFSIRDVQVGDIITVDLRAPDLGQIIGAYRVTNRELRLVSETGDSYQLSLDLVNAPIEQDQVVKVRARQNASIFERLAQQE